MVVNAYGYIILILWITMAQPGGQEKTTALKDLLSRIDLDELMKKDEPPLIFPKTLEEFEYAFNDQGQLRHIKTGEPFVFNYREDLHRWNQKRYEALGEIITQHVYELLEKKCNMTREILPVDASEDEPKSFIYLSKDALNNPDKLLVLIQGRGVVRAGQWARRLIINEDMNSGSQIPFITRAAEKNSTPEEHVLYVWDNFISKSAAKNVFLIAHSYGGLSFVELMIKREAQVKSRVQAVAMTDSVHNVWHQEAGKSILEWMQEHCCNWVSSTEPLDTPLETMLPDCPRISAGTERHELTSWRSFHSIFKFFTATLEAQNSDTKPPASVTTRSSNRNKHEEF
ncbi:cotranscriptional regulator FAM172A homolog isoform X4 [Brienomyrus brachyistius]|uniref:cotranscriptional regulator FAM172A homolog isoform X4 n=1 Tax=Brienomyrus brachyistius TaxID=42636 RepID=UPI0020B43F21|nr:cotranscriptional regulator FAM172A homolog isoform X4 [Brienomyrus brachyistius]